MKPELRNFIDVAANAIAEKLGKDIVALDMSNQQLLSEVFLIATSPNEKAMGAISDMTMAKLSEIGEKPVRIEKSSGWVLLDYVDLVIHIQTQEVRHFYALERLWNDSPRIELAVSEIR